MADANMGKILGSPLCAFCLSPQFSIRAVNKVPVAENSPAPVPFSRRILGRFWRRGDFLCRLPSVRRRFKPSNQRRYSSTLLKNLAGVLAADRKGKTLNIEEVLSVIQRAWKPQCHVERQNSTATTMDDKLRKSGGASVGNTLSSNEIPSPILIRRRLSAPETIMRKHMLAQQRSESQDSDLTPTPESKTRQWRNNNDIDAGSDSNLSTKRDSDIMRKSTLLKRFWSNSKPFGSSRFSGTFYEWQHSFGKLSSGRSTHSLTSIHSSPEHIMRSQSRRSLNGSPQHKASSLSGRKLSPIHQSNHQTPNSNRRKISTYESNFDSYTTSYCSEETAVNSNNNRTVTTSTTTPKTITDFETNTRTTTSCTTFSDNNSDSAYTNSHSNFSRTSNNNSTKSSEINKQILEEPEVPNKDINQVSLKLNNNDTQKNLSSQFLKYSNNNVSETSTQTHESTNVNVISNVHLSQSTLDLIFNQVMQDVQKSVPNKTKTKIKSETIFPAVPSDPDRDLAAVVQPVQSFYLKPPQSEVSKNQNNQIVKYMISNVGTGSPYCKPAEVPQVVVPRYSALPRTTSMEVNISSGDSTDKESDTISLADSLEDSSVFQTDSAKIKDDPNVASDSSVLLPDNSSLKPSPVVSKPTAFFIPIEVEDQTGFSAVSDHLPDKVRNRLLKRQQKREDRLHGKSKLSSSRSDSNYVSASDNGNQVHGDINSNPQLGYNINRAKKRSKLLLPSIKTFRRIKIDKSDDDKGKKLNKPMKRKTLSGEKLADSGQPKSNHCIPNTRKDKLSPVYTTKSEYVYDNDGPKKFYHKTEFNNSNKRIEILEIMECLEPSEKLATQLSKSKSRIPILVHSKLPKMESPKAQAVKPTFLDLSSSQASDPKLDQLIANILIETLNNPNLERTPSPRSNRMFSVVTDNNRPSDQPVKHLSSPKYQQKFEAIPEELSFQSSNEELQNDRGPNNNEVKNNNEDTASPYQGRAAIAVVKDENFSSIPKGWITFYMLHKNRGSPDSTSDEGKDLDNACKTSSYCAKKGAVLKERETCFGDEDEDEKKLRGMGINVKQGKCHLSDTNDNFSSSSSNLVKTAWQPSNGRSRKFNSQRKQRFKVNGDCEKPKELGDWSVTVSGTNTYGQFAPDFQMCLKFPDHKKTHVYPSQSNSGLGDDNERRVQFPKINTKSDRSYRTEDNNENASFIERLPDISRNQLSKSHRKCDSSISSKNAMVPSSVEPRQTRTSLRRYNLTRPKIDPHQALPPDSSRSNFNLFDNRNYADILKHLPEILSITGNAISSDNNSKSPY